MSLTFLNSPPSLPPFPDCFSLLLHLLCVFFASSFPRKGWPAPRGYRLRLHHCRLRLMVVNSASWASPPVSWLLAPPRRGLCSSPSASPRHLRHVAVGSTCCRRLRLVAVTCALWSSTRLPCGRGLCSLLSPLPRRLCHAAVGSSSWSSALLDSFCLVVSASWCGLYSLLWASPHGLRLILPRHHRLCLVAWASPCGLGLVTFALWPSASPHRLHLVAWASLLAVGFASASWLSPPPPHLSHREHLAPLSTSWLLTLLVAVASASMSASKDDQVTGVKFRAHAYPV
ncbi:hypothetical protein NL676_019012 [Syzygium grande]|nr:hypothetical protein NL676_019012 [Syzygium grande]